MIDVQLYDRELIKHMTKEVKYPLRKRNTRHYILFTLVKQLFCLDLEST